MGDTVLNLAAATESLLDAGLTPDEQEDFLQLALELRRRAQELAETAPTLSEPELDERAAAVERACANCHARFRIPR